MHVVMVVIAWERGVSIVEVNVTMTQRATSNATVPEILAGGFSKHMDLTAPLPHSSHT